MRGGALQGGNSDGETFFALLTPGFKISAVEVQQGKLAAHENTGSERQHDAHQEQQKVGTHRAPTRWAPQGL